MNSTTARVLLAVFSVSTGFLLSGAITQFAKNREFRQRIQALEAQVSELRARVDQPVLRLDPPKAQ